MQPGCRPLKGNGRNDIVSDPGMIFKPEQIRLFGFQDMVFGFFSVLILAGLAGTWLPSFGFLPVIGTAAFSMEPWVELFKFPGIASSIKATLISGWLASSWALFLSMTLISLSHGTKTWAWFEKLLAPLLSIPHAGFAMGFAFLIAPGGWILRLISPDFTNFTIPPDWIIINDSHGLTLAACMVFKETPFLLFMAMGALTRINVTETLTLGQSLGYHRAQVWIKLILPRLFPDIRLAFYAVTAYSLSVVDLSVILGPTAPPTLSVLVLQWFSDPDINMRLIGAAGACTLLLIVVFSLGSVYLFEKIFVMFFKTRIANGKRKSLFSELTVPGNMLLAFILVISFMSVLVLIIWSFTWRWTFPDFLPGSWSVRFWFGSFSRVKVPLFTTMATGICTTLAAVVLTIGCLECGRNSLKKGRGKGFKKIKWLIYLPLLIPQIAFINGIQVILTMVNLDGLWISLVLSHLIFVFPYLFLTLSGIYENFDARYTDTASMLCGSRLKSFFLIKLPMLTGPVLFASAIGFSVSVAQYVPTVFLGAGRFTTITTEAVNMAAGSDRRIVAVYALYQLALPMVMYMAAIYTPRLVFINRKNMLA